MGYGMAKRMTTVLSATAICGWLWTGVGMAAEPVIQKTFEAEKTVEYTILLKEKDVFHRLVAIKRKADGDVQIKYTPPQPVVRFDELVPALTRLIRAADTLNPGRISSLLAFEYFDCKEMILDAAVAFKNHRPWKAFLKARKSGNVQPSYREVAAQLRRAKVFQPVSTLFRSVGYCAHFSRFQKLAVRPIGPVIEKKQLAERDLPFSLEIPVPLVLRFTTTPASAAPCPTPAVP